MSDKNTLDIIRKARERNARWLNLSNLGIEELPLEIGLITELEELQLHKNQLPRLPQEFWSLVNLKKLTLAGNLLEELSVEIGRFKELEELRLGGYWKKVGSERDWDGGKGELKCVRVSTASGSEWRVVLRLRSLPLAVLTQRAFPYTQLHNLAPRRFTFFPIQSIT